MLNNMKIGTRLALAFILILLLLLINSGMSLRRISQLNGHVNMLVNDRMPKLELSYEIKIIST